MRASMRFDYIMLWITFYTTSAMGFWTGWVMLKGRDVPMPLHYLIYAFFVGSVGWLVCWKLLEKKRLRAMAAEVQAKNPQTGS